MDHAREELEARLQAAEAKLVQAEQENAELARKVTARELHISQLIDERTVDEVAFDKLADAVAPYRDTPEDRGLWEHEDGSVNVQALVDHVLNTRDVGEDLQAAEARLASQEATIRSIAQEMRAVVDNPLIDIIANDEIFERWADTLLDALTGQRT